MFFVILESFVRAINVKDAAIGEWHVRYKDAPAMIPFTVEIHKKSSGQLGGSIWRNMKIQTDDIMSVDDFATLFDVNIHSKDSGKVIIGEESIDVTIVTHEKGATCTFTANGETHEIILADSKQGTGTWNGNAILIEKRDPLVSKSHFYLTWLVVLVTIVQIVRWMGVGNKKKNDKDEKDDDRQLQAERKKDDDIEEKKKEEKN